MPDLTVTRGLPNPAGKDRTAANRVTNDQLNGEWMQFQNTSGKKLSIDGVSMLHRTFNNRCQVTGDEHLTTFKGTMPQGYSIRLHTGTGDPFDDPNDPTLRHLFLNRGNYVWNNTCGDRATLRVAAGEVDHAYYEPNPPEGVVLDRLDGTHELTVPVATCARRW